MIFNKFIDSICSNKRNTFLMYFFLLIILSVFMVFIFMPEDRVYLGYDVFFHYRRLQSLMDALQHGAYPIYLDYSAADNFGYASNLFYPDFMLIPFAFIGNLPVFLSHISLLYSHLPFYVDLLLIKHLIKYSITLLSLFLYHYYIHFPYTDYTIFSIALPLVKLLQ